MDPYIFGFFAIMYVIIFIWGLQKHKKTASAIIFFVVVALIYDNGVLAIGHLIGEGTLLKNLNISRYWVHAFLTPTLILFSFFVLKEAGIKFVQKTWVKATFIALTVVAIVVEYFVELQKLKVALQRDYGVLSYASTAEANGPPPMILIVIVVLVIAAIILVKQTKWWWMLIGTIVMTIGSAIPFNIDSNAITNAFELFLLFTLMKTAIHFSNTKKLLK